MLVYQRVTDSHIFSLYLDVSCEHLSIALWPSLGLWVFSYYFMMLEISWNVCVASSKGILYIYIYTLYIYVSTPIPHRIHVYSIWYHLPSIYPSHVSIYIPAPWIRHGYRKDSILRFSWEPRTDTTCPLCRLMSSRFHSVRWTWMSHLAPCYNTFPCLEVSWNGGSPKSSINGF